MRELEPIQLAVKPDWVRLPPDAVPGDSPIITRTQQLPFDALTWQNFERLCFRLAAEEGDVAHWALFGRAGQKQDGIDIFVRHRSSDKYTCWQVKKRKVFTAALVRQAIKRFLDGQWAGNTDRFILCVHSSLQDASLQTAIETEAAKLKPRGIELVPLDFAGLTLRLKSAPKLIDDFFGREWVAATCGLDVAESLAKRLTGADMVSLRRELLDHYRHYFDSIDPGLIPLAVSNVDVDQPPSLLDRFIVPDVELALAVNLHEQKREAAGLSADDPSELPSSKRLTPFAASMNVRQPISSWLAGAERNILIADAGYGKSTILRALALALLSGGPQFPEATAIWADRLPILIPFAFWSRLVAASEADISLLDAAKLWFRKFDLSPKIYDLILRSLNDSRLLLLVDGLDEWADESAGRSTLTLLDTFVKTKKIAVVVTGRPGGLLKLGGLDSTWRRAKLAPLSDTQQRRFTTLRFGRATGHAEHQKGDGQSGLEWRVNNFFQDLQQIVRLGPLAEIPLMLSGLISLAQFKVALPQSRFGAYDELIKLMLEEHPNSRARASLDKQSRYEVLRDASLRRRALAFLAHHNRNVIQQSSFSIIEAKKTMSQFLRDCEGLSQLRSSAGADEILGITSETAGLLVEKAPGEIAFVHSLFEEVLAGEYLSGMDLQAQRALMQAHSGDPRWTNVLLSLVNQLPRAQDVDCLLRSIFPSETADPGAATINRLCAEIAFGEFKCSPLLGSELAEFVFSRIETGSWQPEKTTLLALALDSNNEARRENIEAKLKSWFPGSLRQYERVYAALCDWQRSPDLEQCFWKGLFAEDDENKMAAARAIAVKFKGDPAFGARLRTLVGKACDDGTIAAGLEALWRGWADAEYVSGLIAEARRSDSSKLQVVAIRAALANKSATAADMEALLEFANTDQYRLGLHGVGNALCQGASLSATIVQTALEAVGNDSGSRHMDFMLGKAVLLVASSTNSAIDEEAARLIRQEKFFFSMMSNDWGLRPYGPKVREAIDEVLLKPDNVMHNEVANAIIASRSPKAKARALQMLEEHDSWFFWPIHALLTGWGAEDSEVSAAFTGLPTAPEQAQYFAQYLPAIISDKLVARGRLLEIARLPQLVRLDFVTTGFARLGVKSSDREVMDTLLANKFERTGVYDASDALISNFGDEPRVRAIALSRAQQLEAPWEAIARAYENDKELRNLVMSRLGALSTRLRSAIVDKARRRCDDRIEFRDLLQQYGAEEQRDCRNAAALGHYEFITRNNNDLAPAEERLKEEIIAIGPYMDDVRQSAFLGMAAIGKLPTVAGIVGLERGGLNFFDMISDSPTLLSYLARHWKSIKEALGSDGFWRLNRFHASEAEAWRHLAPYAAESPEVRDDFLTFARVNPARLGALAIETLSRISPRSQLLREQCLRVLDGKREGGNPYDSARSLIVAGRILGTQFADDDGVRSVLEAYRFSSSAVVIGLALGWPTSPKLKQLFQVRQAELETPGNSHRGWDYTLPAVLHLFGACSSAEQFLTAIDQVIEQCGSDIWDFGEYLALPITTRLETDAAFASLMIDALSKTPTPNQKASYIRLLASSGVHQKSLRTLCVAEYTYQSNRPHIQEFGFDLMSGSIRPVSHAILDVLTPDLN